MNNITYAVSVDVNNPIIPYNVYVASVLDSNVRYLEITLYQNGNIIALSNEAAATASLVTDNVLIDDSVECTISNNIITVPLEDLQRHGNLDVQVTVTEGTKVLAIPFPIQVRVTPNIAENAQIDENSLGSYAEVVHEIAEARGTYTTLHDAIATKAPLSTAYTFDTTTTNVVYNANNPKTIYLNATVDNETGIVITAKDNDFQYFLGRSGTLKIRYFSGGTSYSDWAQKNESINNKQSSITAYNKYSPTMYPSIKAVVDYLTANYIGSGNNTVSWNNLAVAVQNLINGKENTSNKLTSEDGIDSTSTDAQYPSAKAVYGLGVEILALVNDDISNVESRLVLKESSSNKQSSITDVNKASTALYPSIKAVVDYLAANYEDLSNKLSSEAGIDEDSTDTEYPTAKAVFDFGVQIVDDFNENIMETNSNLSNLKERLDHTGALTDEQVAEAVADYLDEHPGIISAKGDGTSPLADKNIVVFGDSLTDPQSEGISWTESFINVAEYNSFRGYGRGWCTWTFKNDTEYNITDNTDANVGSNVIWNQFNKLKHDVDNNNTPIPDIIIIFCAANDALQSKTIGSESATFQAEAQSSDVKTLTNMMDSIRYNIDTINAEYPNCIIVPIIPLLPPQYAKSKTYRDALITCYNNLGLSYIDVMYGSGIAWYREVMKKTYFANDRIHLSEAGSMKVAKFIYQSLITMPRIQKLPSTTTNKGLYNVYYNFTNATSTNSFASVMQGEPYRAIISATTGYSLTSVTCTMGGVTQPVTGGLIDIANVTGDIRITAVGGSSTPTTYTVTNNLTNATNSNAATSVTEGDSYTATISANTGYRITSVTCTMGSTQQTVTNNTINIASVTGNIVITAVTEQDQPTVYYTVTNNLTNATNSNVAAFVEEGTAYTATIFANRGHHMSSVTCTMDGVEQTVTDNTINIASVSGNIIITAVAESDFVPVEGAYIHNDGNCWVGTSYYPTRNTTKLELVANVHSFSGDFSYLVGSTSTKLCQWQSKDAVGCIAGDGMQYDENLVTVSYDKKFTLYADIANKVLTITDEDGTRTSEIRVGREFVTNPMWYFAGYWRGNFEHKSGDMKVYSMKIWEGDTLVYEGYPINDVNGAGMYDTITGTTSYNEGTGTLTYGVDSVS